MQGPRWPCPPCQGASPRCPPASIPANTTHGSDLAPTFCNVSWSLTQVYTITRARESARKNRRNRLPPKFARNQCRRSRLSVLPCWNSAASRSREMRPTIKALRAATRLASAFSCQPCGSDCLARSTVVRSRSSWSRNRGWVWRRQLCCSGPAGAFSSATRYRLTLPSMGASGSISPTLVACASRRPVGASGSGHTAFDGRAARSAPSRARNGARACVFDGPEHRGSKLVVPAIGVVIRRTFLRHELSTEQAAQLSENL
jgi:hypothetical protein